MSEGTGNLGCNRGYPNAFVVVMISVRMLLMLMLLLIDLLTAVLMRPVRNRVVKGTIK
jgi:hypothetical protein